MKYKGDEQVLIAEDDENDAYFIRYALEAAGITKAPQLVVNGRDAIQYLEGAGPYADRTKFPYPDLILTDLKMPIASGFELLKWLDEHPNLRVIPTVVFSSSSNPEDVKRAHCLGASAYICKPSDPVEFREVIARLLRFWEICERPAPAMPPACGELIARLR